MRHRIACLGGSITFGLGLPDRRQNCYPAVLDRLLGEAYHVRNFGYSGACVGRSTNDPYWETPSFIAAQRFEPHFVLIALGTNDAQDVNRDQLPSFAEEFVALVEHFRGLPSTKHVAVALPPPVFEPLPGIDIAALDRQIRPAVREVASDVEATLLDAYTPFVDRADLFPDNLHPNVEGARMLAEQARDVVVRM